MFSKRGSLGSNRHWDRAFLSQLGADLAEAGFKQITTKLPVDLEILLHDEIPVEQRIDSELKKREITFEEFLNRERNYPAVVIVAQNQNLNETIKILFVNISRKTSFMDATFPSGHSMPSQLYVQSPDPARVHGLFNFFIEYLNRQGQSTAGLAILGLASMFLAATELVYLVGARQGILQGMLNVSPLLDVLLFAGLVIIQYRYFKAPTGVSVNQRETETFSSFIQRASKGEFKDNPLVSIAVGVIASIISAIVLKLIGWP